MMAHRSQARRWRERAAWGASGILALAVIALYGGVIQAGPLDPPGPPAPTDGVRTPGTPISSLPIGLGTPGRYYLTRDLTYNGPGNAVTISASDIELDLNGFTLHVNSGSGVTVNPGQTRVRISNGTITGSLGRVLQLSSATATQMTLEDLTFTNSAAAAIALQENAIVRRVTVTQTGGAAITVGANSTVEHALVNGAVSFGIDVGPNSAVRDCTVREVNGGAAGQAAIRVGDDSTVERCTVSTNPSAGIRGGNGVVVSQSVSTLNLGGDGVGINLGVSSVVVESTARQNASAGIVVGNYSVVEGSTARNNGASGIVVGARAVVRDSTSTGNDVDGISATTAAGTLFENNLISDNDNDGIEAGTGVRIVNNTFRGNGLATAGTADGAAINLTATIAFVEGNLMVSNDVGILSVLGNNTIIRNVARDNPGGNYMLQADDLNGVDITAGNVATDTHSHYNYSP